MSTLALPAARGRRASVSHAAVVPWLLFAPALTLMALMLIGPTIAVTLLAFTDYQLGAAGLNWIGIDNFREMAHERTFWRSLGNTLVYAAVVVPGSVLLGLGAALLVESGTSLRSFYRAVFFLPVMATLIAMAISWEFMLHPSFGLVNLALRSLGYAGANWLRTDTLALGVIAVIGIWQQFGFNMVLFIAGLVSIPKHLYEAAAMDGVTGPWERFRLVTWPMLGPVTLFVVMISAIRSFQVFDTVAVLTKGGPNKATEVLLYTMYAEGFEFFRSGYAASITVIFLVLVLIVTLIKRKLMERQVHYD
jgi:multiple sugar transport system permease protein